MMRTKHFTKSLVSVFLAVVMLSCLIPSADVFAAQSNAYVDPVDVWLHTNNRTGELDANATVTYTTGNCSICGHDTPQTVYRVPEYTRSGETALNHGVKYSDGAGIGGEDHGNVDSGTPGVDAYYTGYHWSATRFRTGIMLY